MIGFQCSVASQFVEACDSVKIIAISCGMISLKVRYDYRMPRVKSHREMSYRAISHIGIGLWGGVDTRHVCRLDTQELTHSPQATLDAPNLTQALRRDEPQLVVPSYFACPNGAIARAAETRAQVASARSHEPALAPPTCQLHARRRPSSSTSARLSCPMAPLRSAAATACAQCLS